MKSKIDTQEVNALIQMLQAQGITYLVGSHQPLKEEETSEPVQFIQRLVSCGFPLVEHACISLFILHPKIASSVLTAIQKSDPEIAERITTVALATLYMQQWWFFRLTLALGRLPAFPEDPFRLLWEERHLPAPSVDYGREGFLALEKYEQQRYGIPLNFRGDWQNQINHLLSQEESKHHQLSDETKYALKQYPS